jgi:anti-sigma factor RsiW
MRVEVDHQRIQELLGAYALHAVDAREEAAVERHIPHCEECRQELEQHREVAALLSTTERFAPAELWDSIIRQIPTDSTSRPATPAAPTTPVAAPDATIIPLRRQWLRPAAAAAVLALVVGSTVVQTARLNSANDQLAAEQARVMDLNDQLQRPPLDIAVAQAMAGADTQRLTLGSQVSGANAIIVLMPDGTGYLAEHTLQPLPPDRTYQLWAIVDGKIISAGILGADPGVVPFRIDPQGFAGFAITEEVVGGVEASENEAVIAWLEA